MDNYHDDLRVAAQEVVDARMALKRLYVMRTPTQIEEVSAVNNIYESIERLKRVLEIYDA